MRLIRLSGWVFVLLLLATAVVMGVGSRLPAESVAVASTEVAAPREQVWGLLTEVTGFPGWRMGLKSVAMVPTAGGQVCWRETRSWMTVPWCVVESVPQQRWVVRVADPRLPFGGEWTYELADAGSRGTRVTLTTRRRAGPAMWRFADRYVTREDMAAGQLLRDLGRVCDGRRHETERSREPR